MRALLATGVAVSLVALDGGAQAREVSIYRGKCGEVVLPSGPTGLDSALRIRTACGTFVADRHGIRSVGPFWAGPKWDGLMARRGRLVLYRGGRVVWRSRLRRYGVPTWIVEGARSFAFMARDRLFVAELDGPERAVGRLGEYPLGWTRAGLLVTAQEKVLRARTRSGRLVRTIETQASRREFDAGSGTLVYVSGRGALIRTDGRRAQTLVARGLGSSTDIRPLEEGRLAFVDRRVVVLGPDGSVLASDQRRFNLPALTSNGAIAMIATGPLENGPRATESVRLLRPGQRSSTLLHTAKVGVLGCGHWPTLAWRGDQLLYSTSEGHVVVMEPSSGEHLDLTAVVKRFPGAFLEARWR